MSLSPLLNTTLQLSAYGGLDEAGVNTFEWTKKLSPSALTLQNKE